MNYDTRAGLRGGIQVLAFRVLIVDDYSPWRSYVANALETRKDVEIVGEAQNGLAALEKVLQFQPDIVVLDIGLPVLNGIQVARKIREAAPKTKVIFLSDNTSLDVVRDAMLTGAHAFVTKSSAARDFLHAFEAVLLGSSFVSISSAEGRRKPVIGIKPVEQDE